MDDEQSIRSRLSVAPSLVAEGRVSAVVGLALRLRLPTARIGDVVEVHRRGGILAAEVVGFVEGEVVAMPLGELTGVGPDDPVFARGEVLSLGVGKALLGRVVNGYGRLIDGGPPPSGLVNVPVERPPPPALSRKPVTEALPTGVRVIDGLLTFGKGQRVGLFAGSGVGKSTLMGAIARGVVADVVVIALVGERGREVGEFIEESLGAEGQKRAVVVVATSDAPALERYRAAQSATAIAEYFRDQGQSVLLMVDSITRFARAAREIGLAAGEPPARRGYPPSVFAALPRLLERSGQGSSGAITALYTVLVEGGDMDEPIADEVRGILDGHIVLDRAIAERGVYPAVDVLQSLSRVMPRCAAREHLDAARALRLVLGCYESKRDLIALGAYKKGSDKELDQAIAGMPKILDFLRQSATEAESFPNTLALLKQLS
jgi:ATP synthase in type III secretion protein N